MKQISAAEARKHLAEITDEVQQKKVSYAITKHGKPVARISPIDESGTRINPKLKQELTGFFERYDSALKELAQR